MISKIQEACKEGRIEKIIETARRNDTDIILAPDNEFGRDINQDQIKKELKLNFL